MQLGIIGLGRMGANIARRLLARGHECVVYNRHRPAVSALVAEGARGAASITNLIEHLRPPRPVWMMVPADAVEAVIAEAGPALAAGDCLIDGGNSHFELAIRRAGALAARGVDYLDVGTSGGIHGLERGFCLMVGGPTAAVERLTPVFRDLAPGRGDIAATPGLSAGSTAPEGWLHCGPSGAGHYTKMVHNGIEYGLMAAYAEGFNLLRHAGYPGGAEQASSTGTPYDFDLAAIAELWRRGSVVSSWLLDLAATALAGDAGLQGFEGHVADSGEGRWTLKAAIDSATPVPVLSAALYSRFASRGEAEFANRLLSALRYQFGGHRERPASE